MMTVVFLKSIMACMNVYYCARVVQGDDIIIDKLSIDEQQVEQP